ncbi:MAG TPA: hypothetical protein DER08_06715 [Flavobacterium sp.]|nr:MAG: hypothetical protein A2X21_06980 [Flavobacteria bacterium GWA2_35_26]HCF04025.1 hypothetical protein [Flavobacterium sp.]
MNSKLNFSFFLLQKGVSVSVSSKNEAFSSFLLHYFFVKIVFGPNNYWFKGVNQKLHIGLLSNYAARKFVSLRNMTLICSSKFK